MATYCFSDLHAQYDLWQQIKKYLKPDDTVYCLGDCVDRGDVGLKILQEILTTPNIILLRGNHEDFINTVGMVYYNTKNNSKDFYDPDYYELMEIWKSNDAERTIHDFKKLKKIDQINLIKTIRSLPTHIEYINKNGDTIYLCHAGRQPDTPEIQNINPGILPMNNYIWDRFHLNDSSWKGKNSEYCVHGHTPTIHLNYFISNYDQKTDKTKIYKYCEGHKINIDLGSFQTHIICLLNLDTFEPIYFKDRSKI